MKRRDAEKLLGGYAMGILTETERRTLFEAALDHQEVFDALMDEEALRELLADPAVRQRLLTILSEAEPAARVRPFWRRPAVLGLAASLFLVVTTSLVLRRQPTEVLQTRAPEAAKAEPPGDIAAKSVAEPPAAVEAKPRVLKMEGKARRAPLASKPSPMETESLLESQAHAAAKEAAPSDLEKGFQAPGASSLGVAAPSPAMTKRAKAAAELADASRTEERPTEAKLEGAESMGAGSASAPFSHALLRLPDGRYRLRVTWEGDGHVYLLRRAGSAVSEIPAASTQAKAKPRVAVFEFRLEPGQVLDLYLRPHSEPDPSVLSSSDDGQGRWERIVPEPPGP